MIPEMEWMSQALLRVEPVDSEDLVEVTVHGRPRVQNRVKSILLSLASWHRERRAGRGEAVGEPACGGSLWLCSAPFQP